MAGVIKSTRAALMEARAQAEALAAENARLKADLGYVAMMADVELDDFEEDADEQDVSAD